MIPFATPRLGGGFVSFSTVYATTGGFTVPVPAGAKTLMAEAISGGGDGGTRTSGAGGNYARRNAFTLASVSGLTAVDVSVPADQGAAQVTGNDPNSTVIVYAPISSGLSPGVQSSAVGDVFNAGGAGQNGGNSTPVAGGGAGGPNGPGGSDSNLTNTPGVGGGGAAGSGGTSGNVGTVYGGGGGRNAAGVQGWIKLTWS